MRVAALIACAAFGILLTPCAATASEGLPEWRALHFEASKLFLTAKTDLRLSEETAPLDEVLLPSPEGRAWAPPNHRLWTLELFSSAVGRDSRSRVWFDPQSHQAWQRAKERLGSKPYDKLSRYTRDGVYTRRRAPQDDAERNRPADTWTKVGTRFESYPGWQASIGGTPAKPSAVVDGPNAPCSAVLEGSQLLVLLSTLNLDAPPTDLCVFADGAVSKLAFEIRGRSKIKLDLEETRDGTTRNLRETVEAHCVVIRSQPLDGQLGGQLELLGLEGDVEIFLDPERRFPLEVRGKLPHLGSVRVQLVAVDWS